MELNLFTYGSTMIPAVMQRLTGRRPESIATTLHGWQRRRVIDEAFPAAVPMNGESINGIIWKSLSIPEFERLNEGSD